MVLWSMRGKSSMNTIMHLHTLWNDDMNDAMNDAGQILNQYNYALPYSMEQCYEWWSNNAINDAVQILNEYNYALYWPNLQMMLEWYYESSLSYISNLRNNALTWLSRFILVGLVAHSSMS